MLTIPAIGFTAKKSPGAPPIALVDANFAMHTGGTNDVVVPLTGVLAGDIIVCAIGHSGTVFGVPSASGFATIFVQSWASNAAGAFSKVAVGGETSATMTANASGSDPKFGVAMVFRNASSSTFHNGANAQGSSTPRPLGTFTESDNTSISIIFGWLNRTGTNDATISIEPVDYTLAARADGAALSGSTADRIMSAWYRPYANRGAQSPEFTFSPNDFHDTWYSNSRLNA